MLKKTFSILKKNPKLILYYIVFMVVDIILSAGINQIIAPANTEQGGLNQMAGLWIIVCVLSIVFMAGYGRMLASAVKNGKCANKDFSYGLQNDIGRMILSFLLILVVAFGFVMVLAIITIPFTLEASVGGSFGLLYSLAIIIAISCMALFVYPLLMLWYPAMFIDDVKVMEGLRRGAKASKKCYWTLVIAVFLTAMPSLIYSLIIAFTNTDQVPSAGYWIFVLMNVILSFLLLVFTFVAYEGKKDKSEQ